MQSTTEELQRDNDIARQLLDAYGNDCGARIDLLGRIAFLTERAHGFMEHEYTTLSLADLVDEEDREKYAGQTVEVPNPSFDAEKLLLAAGEIGEAFEAIRKGDGENEAEEIADTIIRLIGYAYRKNYQIGQAIHNKMATNIDRPYKHGKLR